MKPTQFDLGAALRGAFLFAALAPVATAQNQIWIRQLGTSMYESATATAPDGAGGVYVSGYTRGNLGGSNAGSYDVWLARYDSAGNQIWIRQFGSWTEDIAYAAAHDGAGGVYLSGRTRGGLSGSNAGYDDVWLARYDSAGNQIWIRQFGSSSPDQPNAAAPDGVGGVYVSGDTWGSLGGPNAGSADAWLAHYDGTGNQTWIRQLGTNDHDRGTSAAPDGSGGVYWSGGTPGSLGGPNAGIFGDAWLARYDSAGNQTWIRQFGTNDDDDAIGAAPDGWGGVYVSGRTRGDLGGPNAGLIDVWLAHYDGTGNQTWIRQLGTNDNDHGSSAAPDGTGGVYLVGTTIGSLGINSWLARYDSAGNQIWIEQLGTSGGVVVGGGAAPDGSGGVFACGSTDGNLGGPYAGGTSDAWLARYDGGLTSLRYCTPAVPNSTGQPGMLTATGSNTVQANDVTLVASYLSLNSFGFFLTSRDQGNVFPVSNSQGRLCLGGSIGRYVGPGQVRNSGSMGSFSLVLDLTAMAHPVSPVTVQPGQTWHFQAWHRDANPTLTSNFTDAVSVTFH